MATKITKKPSLTVSKLGAPTRGSGNRKMTATWKIPSDLVSTKKNNRATGLEIDWIIDTTDKKDPKKVTTTGNEKLKTSTINLDGLKIGNTTYNRSSFYPNTSRKLNGVTVVVKATNGKGKGKPASETRKFATPRVPTLSELSFNTENGVISTTIDTDAGADYKERYDTKYTMTITSPFENDGNPFNSSDSASTSTSFDVTYDASDYSRLDYDQFIKVVASAYARGYAGNSNSASRTEYISYPAQATIEGVDVSGRDATGKCTVRVNPNSTTEHPVDKVKLQIAADVTYDDANDIPASEWEDTEIIDNRNCTALSIATSELIPSRGNYSYVRVVTYHLHEGVLYRYSKPWRVTELEVPTAPPASINIEILEAHTGADGKSAVVLLGWNKDGQDDFTGTELSWSNDENTWKSTDEPSTHQFTWSDGEIEYGGVTYHDSAEITIKGLNEGEKYYIKARRYLEADNEQYSAYSNTATALTSEMPESIVASCERYIANGNPLSVYWTFAGNGIQTEWQIVRVAQYVKTKDEAVLALAVAEPVNDDLFRYYELSGTTYTLTSDTSVVEGKDYYIINKTYYTKSGEVYTAVASPADSSVSDYYEFYDNTVIAEGKGSAGATQISAERLAEMATDNSLSFIVQASTGSGFVSSEEHTVTIIEQPTLQITGSSLVHVHEEDEQTYTGDIVQIDNRREVLNVKSLEVDLQPIQDLHGYDKPWSKGNGKNIFHFTASRSEYTWSDGFGFKAVSVDDDGVTFNGTASASHTFSVTGATMTLPIGSYRVSTTSDNIGLGVLKNGVALATGYGASGRPFTVEEETEVTFSIYAMPQASFNNQFVGFQIEATTASTSSAWTPYENLCPISGRTECVTEINGGNFWDEEWEVGGLTYAKGLPYSASDRIRSKNFSKCVPNVTYCGTKAVSIFFYDAEQNYLGYDGINAGGTFTTPTNAHFFKIVDGSATTYNNDISINYPSTDTAYHAYNGQTYTTTLGRTVYGSDIEIVGGEGADKMGMVDLGTLTWSMQSAGRFYATNEGMSDSGNAILSAYQFGGNKTTSSAITGDKIAYTQVYWQTEQIHYSRIWVLDSSYSDVASFTSAMSGVQLCYELAQPQTFQLTPQQIELLSGLNTVWNNSGEIGLKTVEVLIDEDQLRTNNLSIDFKSNQLCDLITIVTSQGATGQFPQGVLMQASGDTIHSDVYRPEWTASNNDLTATINLPTGLNFWDGGRYTVSVVAVDRTTGLRSPETTLAVPVNWINQAVPPEQESYSLTTDTTVVEDEAYYEKVDDDYILVTPVGTENPSSEGWYTQDIISFVTLTVIDEKDSDGDHTQAVRIALTPPTGSSESDVYDIYRMDIESPSLIGEGFPLTYTAVDEYAPFGNDVELKYRIAVRTVDGDVAFSDIEYEADCENIRFDWSGGSLELPYGNTVGDSFTKDTEIRKHMNGVSNGYWNQGVERKSSLSSNIIKIVQPRDIERARMLARYAGVVFVRLPNGSAFEADVQVTDLSIKNEAVTAVAFDATEVGLTQEFSLPIPFRLEE